MKKYLAVLITIILSLMSIPLSGCNNKYANPWNLKKEDQGYYYYVVGDDGYIEKYNSNKVAIILGITNENAGAEELIIPQKLGGYPVIRIGELYTPVKQRPIEYGINAKSIKRIIINHDCTIDGNYSFKDFKGELVINADVRLHFFMYPTMCLIRFNLDINSLTDCEQWSKIWEYKLRNAVVFNPIGGNQSTYGYAIEENNLIPEPEDPSKDDCEFAGWYVDENYETQWNFETDTVTDNMTLYAKWI